MKFCVMIPTYNRAKCLAKLVARLKKLDPTCHIIVIDDGSNDAIDRRHIDKLVRNNANLGKKQWFITVNKLWQESLPVNADFYIMLPDDALPKNNFFTDALKHWKLIRDPEKIALHLANNGRKRNWTGFDRQHYTKDLYLTQTTEFSFMCLPEFITYRIHGISKARWEKNPLLGSGVGNLLNTHWVNKGRTIYGVKKSLITSNKSCCESKMNPIARKKDPWILK